MENLVFALHRIDSLRDELSGGFAQISLIFAAHGKPISITLRRADGTGLRVRCLMRDVAERVEYGVLEFEPWAGGNEEQGAIISLPNDVGGEGTTIAKLLLRDDSVVCESGFAIRGGHGSELIVVAGAYPYTLAVAVTGISGSFEPEFPLEKYDRVVFA